jgi:uncharacterized protein
MDDSYFQESNFHRCVIERQCSVHHLNAGSHSRTKFSQEVPAREPKLKARAVWLVLAIFAFGIPVAIADTGAVEKQVFETLLQQAKNGDGAAQFIVGMMCAEGVGTERSDEEAVRWYRLSANQSYADAQYNLGTMYQAGRGVSQDLSQAAQWYRRAADQAHALAAYSLGGLYRGGRGVEKSDPEAARFFLLAAELGDARAQGVIGWMYSEGVGVNRNLGEAFRWLSLAADQGDPVAQNNLARAYENGMGVARDNREAVAWYRRAAEQGYMVAQTNLGVMYAAGTGLPKDNSEAVYWFRKAVEQGYAVAQHALGTMYRLGEGVPRDYGMAARLYQLAAEQGHSGSQKNLGLMYQHGMGVPQDNVLAYMWLRLALQAGDSDAVHSLEIVSRAMTAAERADAERLGASYQPAAPIQPRDRDSSQEVRRELIRQIQVQLATLGYEPGGADGKLGPRTSAAIRSFQADTGMEQNGIPSEMLGAILTWLVNNTEAPLRSTSAEELKLVGTGTGFFVSKEGHFLTNEHVVGGCTHIKVILPSGSVEGARYAQASENDLAVIKVPVAPSRIATFRSAPARLGEDVIVVGYPLRGLLGDGLNVSTGTVAASLGPGNDRRLLQLTAPIQQGNSGGPLLDSTGHVVGVIVSKLDAVAVARATGDIPQNVNFAVKSALATSLLSIYEIPFSESGSVEKLLDRSGIADQARSYVFPLECWN